MTRDELIETIDELAGNSDIFAPPISDRLRDAAAMFRRDGETIERLRKALSAIARRSPIMGSTGDYREGQLDALAACRDVALAAIEESSDASA